MANKLNRLVFNGFGVPSSLPGDNSARPNSLDLAKDGSASISPDSPPTSLSPMSDDTFASSNASSSRTSSVRSDLSENSSFNYELSAINGMATIDEINENNEIKLSKKDDQFCCHDGKYDYFETDQTADNMDFIAKESKRRSFVSNNNKKVASKGGYIGTNNENETNNVNNISKQSNKRSYDDMMDDYDDYGDCDESNDKPNDKSNDKEDFYICKQYPLQMQDIDGTIYTLNQESTGKQGWFNEQSSKELDTSKMNSQQMSKMLYFDKNNCDMESFVTSEFDDRPMRRPPSRFETPKSINVIWPENDNDDNNNNNNNNNEMNAKDYEKSHKEYLDYLKNEEERTGYDYDFKKILARARANTKQLQNKKNNKIEEDWIVSNDNDILKCKNNGINAEKKIVQPLQDSNNEDMSVTDEIAAKKKNDCENI